MKIKLFIFVISFVLALIVFSISVNLQEKMSNIEPTINCLVLKEDVEENKEVKKEFFDSANIPMSLVGNKRIIKRFDEIEGLYARDNIVAGQIAFKDQFDTRENLSIFEAESGKEKISIKIKNAENGMSFQIKEKSCVNVYATLRNEYANGFAINKERLYIGDEFDGYTIIKILSSVKVLGVFTSEGIEVKDNENGSIDSILISVTPEEAKEINLIRDIAVFNITEISSQNINQSGDVKGEDLSS